MEDQLKDKVTLEFKLSFREFRENCADKTEDSDKI